MQAIAEFWTNTLVPAWQTVCTVLGEFFAARPSFLTAIPPLVLRCAFFAIILLAAFCFLQLLIDIVRHRSGRQGALMGTLAVCVVCVFLLGGFV